MTVRELIAELLKVEDKEKEVVIVGEYTEYGLDYIKETDEVVKLDYN